MKLKIFFLMILLNGVLVDSFSQNSAPVVSNVTFTELNGIVDIYYDLNDPDGDLMIVHILVSDNGGATFDFPCTQTTGDIGNGISNGIEKHIIWNYVLEPGSHSGDNFIIKIIANDGVGDGPPCAGISTVTYYDKIYNTVQIGDQCWLKENLDVGTMINGEDDQTDNGIIEKYCYNNLETNCTTYGGFYQWTEAMQYSTTPGTQGICPPNWHIPTKTEFDILTAVVNNDGNKLKAIGEGSGAGAGTNTSGFTALLAGFRNNFGFFYNLDNYSYFWSSTEYDSNNAYYMYLLNSNSNINLINNIKLFGFNIRCLKN
ncbi:MAG: FISUMP domain-containing protein [bacterium]